MPKVMVTLTSVAEPPTIEAIRKRYDLSPNDIDEAFGVIEIDPVKHVYTVCVEESVAARIRPDENWQVNGPFSNPRIAPFGPPEAGPPEAKDKADPSDGNEPHDADDADDADES